MPLYNPIVHDFAESVTYDKDLIVVSGTFRFLPETELTLNGDMEIPIDADVEIL